MSLKHTQLFKLDLSLAVIIVNGFKPIIVDNVELRTEVVGAEVSDQRNVLSIAWGHSNKLASARPRLPLWNLATSRAEPGFKNITRGTPDMGISKSLVITEGAREGFNWCHSSGFIGSVIVQMHCLVDSAGPDDSSQPSDQCKEA